MDCGNDYIKMSDCREIKERWTPHEGDFFWNGMFICIATDHDDWSGNVDYVKKFPKAIWLPRQDQIQEMMGYRNDAYKLLYDFCNYLERHDAYYLMGEETRSIEQLWLAFYMHEKHKMMWGGKKWKKRSL